jgi:hypothetical protein
MLNAVRWLTCVGSCGIAMIFGCTSPVRTDGDKALLLDYCKRGQEIELLSGNVAKCILEQTVYAAPRPPEVFKRTYLLSISGDECRYFLHSVSLLCSIDLPAMKISGSSTVLELHEPQYKASILTFDHDVCRLHPLLAGLESELKQLVQIDLLYGLFFRDIAESCVRDARWEEASGFYNNAIQRMHSWHEWQWIRDGRPGIYEGSLQLDEPSYLDSNGKYSDSVALCRRVWELMAQGVVTSGEDEITVTTLPRVWVGQKDR